MHESGYGSRPDLLPPSVVRLTRTREAGARWVARDGVELLTLEEHLCVERRALGGLPRRSDGTVEWDRRPDDVVRTHEADATALAAEVVALAEQAASVVVLDGSLAVPSVRVPTSAAADVVREMTARATELWVVPDGVPVLLEYAYFQDTVVRAVVPSVDDGPQDDA
ncbi:hypothetical protein [Cellulomonas telluris]|uniref:hypothetical protein n=1 Tax=Cellulomonas telluris TaxID=2306636 RepID=UPI0010A7EE3A|nr:hypothetical protein [Cellulomonas telluris]